MFGVDYAWSRPGGKALQAAGVGFACRYFSHDTTGKNLSDIEAGDLHTHHILTVGVWESTSSRALAGHAAGAQDARDAFAQARACGIPSGRPIYFAVDFPASSGNMAAVMDYLRGAGTVLGMGLVGIYGGYTAVNAAMNAGIVWGWQAYAWSGGNWDDRAQLRQYLNDQTINGASVDYNRSTKADFGGWGLAAPPTPPPITTEEEVLRGQLNTGNTLISWPTGDVKVGIGLLNGPGGNDPLQVVVRDAKGWTPHTITVTGGKAVLHFNDPATTYGLEIVRTDPAKQGTAIAWDAS